MDRARNIRPGTQTPSQPTQRLLEKPTYVASINSKRLIDIASNRSVPHSDRAIPVLRPLTHTPPPQTLQSNQAEIEAVSEMKSDISYNPVAYAAKQPIDMQLPGDESPSTLKRLSKFKIRKPFRRRIVRVTAIGFVLLITLGGLIFSQGYFKLRHVFRGGTASAAALQPNVSPQLLKGEGSGRVNILLLGRGGGNHDGPDLTDTMMVASVDPVNHTTTLLSIPRDLWINVPNQGDMKINAAWETGEFQYLGKVAPGSTDQKAIQAGFESVDGVVENVLGITIDYNVIVDFQAFQQAVDTIGGITVNVPTDLIDPTMAWENGNNPVLAKAGVDTFGGAQALNYVRSRETSSDFARAQRQRDVLMAIKAKVATVGTLSDPLKLEGLLNAFGNNVATDLSISDATRLFSLLSNVSDQSITSTSLDQTPGQFVTTGNLSGQSIVLPTAGLFNYSPIQEFVRGQLKDPYILKENAKILVLNGTNTVGLAANEAALLQSYGYNVIGTGNTTNSNWTATQLVDLNPKDIYTKNYLEQRFATTSLTKLPDNTINANGADFVIILGSDEANTTQP